MVWEYKWNEWFLYDDDDLLRAHIYQETNWCWLIFDLKGEPINRGKDAPTAELAKICVKRIMAT